MKLSYKEAERLHKRLWGWLAETGRKDKSKWPGWKKNGGIFPKVLEHCFACEKFAPRKKTWIGETCNNRCWIKWPENKDKFADDCCVDDSPFTKWRESTTKGDRKKYAAIIRDLPWRKP